MKRKIIALGAAFILALVGVSAAIGATIEGHAYKEGAAQHDGISLVLELPPPIPTVGLAGLLFLLAGLGLLLHGRKNRGVRVAVAALATIGLGCVAYAAFDYATTTNTLGEYGFDDVEVGTYRLDASAPGYYSERVEPVVIEEGLNTLDDITLQPIIPGFVLIPAGTFDMGTETEMCRDGDEDPIHQVTLTRSFYMQQTEVTQEQWVSVFGTNPSYHSGCDQCPVENVTWFDSVIYCNRLSQAEGLRPAYYSDSSYTTVFDGTPPVTSGTVYWDESAPGYRLPTESEWEYACRAGTTTAYNSGQDNTECADDCALLYLAWYRFSPAHETHPVGQKQANAWSLSDMHGNVWEWCWDWYTSTYPSGPVRDPTGPSTGSRRVSRGGGWASEADECRSATRDDQHPSWSSGRRGFRPVI